MTDQPTDTTLAPTADAPTGVQVNNRITIVMPALPPATGAAKPTHKAVAAPKRAPVFSPKDVASPPYRPLSIFDEGLFNALYLTPETYYDDARHQHTRFTTPEGSSAVLKEDPKNHNHVELTLTDGKTGLVTTVRGDARGFTAGADATTAWPVLPDTLTCGKSTKQINTNETESVTRERLQQFAGDHPAIAAALRRVPLPVTEMGGLPVTFAQAVDTPTQFRACPTNRSGILLELLTEKSAKR